MQRLLLHRTDYRKGGTRGVLFLPTGDTLHTIENPWADNKQNISCIPEGTYDCSPRRYYRGGYETFEVDGVPNRDLILFHIGNTELDVDGCIAVGLTKGTLGGLPAVLSSRPAFFDVFWPAVKDLDAFELKVRSSDKVDIAPLIETNTTHIRCNKT